MYTVYDSNPVPVTYTQAELEQVIDDFIKETSREFSFRRLCSHIIEKAISEKKVEKAETTQYSSREMNPLSSIEVSRYLWKLIWDKKIFIAFGENPYAPTYKNDTRFVINK